MKIKDIYEKYKIPPNLAEHMLRVAKVALSVCEHWKGPKVDVGLIKKACLLHDMGNIVRFDFGRHPELIGQEDVNYWQDVQDEFTEKYGNSDYGATTKILQELGVYTELSRVLYDSFWDAIRKYSKANWEAKIFLYSDARVGPYGVLPMRERLEEVVQRRGRDRKAFKKLMEVCLNVLEREIQKNLDIPVSEITDKSVARRDEELLNTEI